MIGLGLGLGHGGTSFLVLGISPSGATKPPLGSQTFAGTGGSGVFSYSLATNNSGGSINASTGAYVAGTTGSVSDTVRVTDTLTTLHVDATVTVTAGVSMSNAGTVVAYDTATFAASGGSGTGYSYAITTNNSGGSINSSTGVYTAGGTGNVTDTITVTDSLGNTATATADVWSPANLGSAVTHWYLHNTSVSTWTDEKGANDETQGTGANQPTTTTINGHNALHGSTTGPTRMANGDTSISSNKFTLACVYKVSSFTQSGGVGGVLVGKCFSQAGPWLGCHWTTDRKLIFGNPTADAKCAMTAGNADDNALHRVIGVYDGSLGSNNATMYLDGVEQTTHGTDTATYSGASDSWSLWRASGSSAGATEGDIGNVLILKATALAGTIGDLATNLGKLDRYLKLWAGM